MKSSRAARDFFVGGVDGQLKLGKNFSVGAHRSAPTATREDPFDLRALNAIYRIGPNTLVIAEAASTDRGSVGKGNAQRFELSARKRALAGALVRRSCQRKLFQSVVGSHTRARRIGGYGIVSFERQIATARRSAAYQRHPTWRHAAGRAAFVRACAERRATFGTGHSKCQRNLFPNTQARTRAVEPVNFTSLRARLTGQVPSVRDLSVFTEYERALSGDGQALSVGGQYQLGNRTRLYAVHELISSLDGRYALERFSKPTTRRCSVSTPIT